MQGEPSKSALDDPAVGQCAEPFARLGVFDNLDLDLTALRKAQTQSMSLPA